MRRNILYLILAGAALTSCFKDNRLDNVPQDMVAFSEINLAEPATAFPEITVCSGHYAIGVNKTGRGQSAIYATLILDTEGLEAINAREGTSYKALPVSLLTYSADDYHFAAGDIDWTSDIRWKVPEVEALMAGSPGDYVIPLRLTAGGEGQVKEGRESLVIKLVSSDIRLAPPSGGEENSYIYSPLDPYAIEVLEVAAILSAPNKRDDLVIDVLMDESLIPDFQTATGNYYSLPPEGAANLYASQVTIPRGEVRGTIRVLLDNSKLGEKHPGYVIPLKISSLSLPVPVTRETFFITIKPVL